MDLVLLTITVGSLGLALGLGIIGWKLLRHSGADTDARVEHLRALASAEDAPEVPLVEDAIRMPEEPNLAPAHAVAHARLTAEPTETVTPVPVRLSTFADEVEEMDLEWDAPLGHLGLSGSSVEHAPALDAALFAPPAPTSAPTRRLALVGAVALVMLGTAGTAYAVYRPQTLPSHRVATDAAAPSTASPLDLLSLTQSIDPEGTFIVTGLVGNPPAGQSADRVMAVVYLFDRDGHYFATGRAGLDESALAPGGQSPFVVKIAHGANAARYRVGFRLLDGAVVAHVDKRGQPLEGTTEVKSKDAGQ
jgi:hypothetical protein